MWEAVVWNRFDRFGQLIEEPDVAISGNAVQPGRIASIYAPCPKPLPPRHLPETEPPNDPPRRLRRYLKRLGQYAGRDQRFCHDQLDQFRQL